MAEGRHIDVNDALAAMTGFTREEARSLDALTIVHPDMRGMVGQRAARRLQGEEQPSRYLIKPMPREGKPRGNRGLNPNGGLRWQIIRSLNPYEEAVHARDHARQSIHPVP